jgi:hypothetical protein
VRESNQHLLEGVSLSSTIRHGIVSSDHERIAFGDTPFSSAKEPRLINENPYFMTIDSLHAPIVTGVSPSEQYLFSAMFRIWSVKFS